jgi:hypothetical protein
LVQEQVQGLRQATTCDSLLLLLKHASSMLYQPYYRCYISHKQLKTPGSKALQLTLKKKGWG